MYIFSIRFINYDSNNQSLKWSLLGVKKRLGRAQIDLLKIEIFGRAFPPLSCGSSPGNRAERGAGGGMSI